MESLVLSGTSEQDDEIIYLGYNAICNTFNIPKLVLVLGDFI